MGKKWPAIALIGGVSIVCLIGLYLLLPAAIAFSNMATARHNEAYLQKPDVYEPVACTLALYRQSDPSLYPEPFDRSWFPAELQDMPGWGKVTSNYALIEIGGGFHHYGYFLELDEPASSLDTNVWHLFLYSEGSADKHLYTLTLPITATLPVSGAASCNESAAMSETLYSQFILRRLLSVAGLLTKRMIPLSNSLNVG